MQRDNDNNVAVDLTIKGGPDTENRELDTQVDKLEAVKMWHSQIRPAVLAVYNAALMTANGGTRAKIVGEMDRIKDRFLSTSADMTHGEQVAMAFGMGAAVTSWGAKQDDLIRYCDTISPSLASGFILAQAHQEMAFCLMAEVAMAYGEEAGLAMAMSKMPVPTITAKGVH